MTHIHWVPRQNKLETPKEKDEVKKREVHECDVRTRDPDAMVDPPTPKPTKKVLHVKHPCHNTRARSRTQTPKGDFKEMKIYTRSNTGHHS